MSTRARGANALLTGGFEATYGLSSSVPAWMALAFNSTDGLAEEQQLEESEILGNGREPQDPLYGVIDDAGNVVVPVDLRLMGWWFKLIYGAPVTVQGNKATGYLTFASNPANNGTITINGTVITYKTSGADGITQVNIGATLADTIASTVWLLNGSADVNITPATYTSDATNATKLNVEYDTAGTGGNAFTLAADAGSHATVSAGTLAGGTAGGSAPYRHTFSSGATALPSMTLQQVNPEVPSYETAYGVMGDKLTLPFSRQAKFAATIATIAQGSSGSATQPIVGAGTPAATVIERFTNFGGLIYRDGVVLGNVMSGSLTYANNLDKAEIMRGDGRIDGADPGQVSAELQLVTKFATRQLFDLAQAKTPIEVRCGWTNSASKKLTFIQHRLFLPRAKIPIQNPSGIQTTFNLKSAEHPTLLKSMSVELVNDVASYA